MMTWDRFVNGWLAVRFLLASLLLTAAGLKGHQLATEPVANESLFTSRWLLIGVVELEIGLGIWLLVGAKSLWLWRAAMALFAGFAGVSLYTVWQGFESCGCFGRLVIAPEWALTVDFAALMLLVSFPPKSIHSDSVVGLGLLPTKRREMLAVVCLSCLLGFPSAMAMAFYAPATVNAAGELIGDGKIVLLEPETWIGNQFPLSPHIDVGDEIATGQWLVVLYHHDCPNCQTAIPHYLELSRHSVLNPNVPQIALVQVPPYATRINWAAGNCVWGRLSDEREWFVTAPVEIAVTNGKVTDVSHELRMLKIIDEIDPANSLSQSH